MTVLAKLFLSLGLTLDCFAAVLREKLASLTLRGGWCRLGRFSPQKLIWIGLVCHFGTFDNFDPKKCNLRRLTAPFLRRDRGLSRRSRSTIRHSCPWYRCLWLVLLPCLFCPRSRCPRAAGSNWRWESCHPHTKSRWSRLVAWHFRMSECHFIRSCYLVSSGCFGC